MLRLTNRFIPILDTSWQILDITPNTGKSLIGNFQDYGVGGFQIIKRGLVVCRACRNGKEHGDHIIGFL